MPCIQCGLCHIKCPLNLDPRKKEKPDCIQCGICNMVCPANINLVDKDVNYAKK